MFHSVETTGGIYVFENALDDNKGQNCYLQTSLDNKRPRVGNGPVILNYREG